VPGIQSGETCQMPHGAEQIARPETAVVDPVNLLAPTLVAHGTGRIALFWRHALLCYIRSSAVRGGSESPAATVGKPALGDGVVPGQHYHGDQRLQMRQEGVQAVAPECTVATGLPHVVNCE